MDPYQNQNGHAANSVDSHEKSPSMQDVPTIRKPSHHKSYTWANRLGFQAQYDFYFWAFSSFSMALLVLSRSRDLNVSTYEQHAAPGEWYWFRQNPYRFGIFLHIYTTLPAGALAIVQFLPVIRARVAYVHKYIGYAIMILLTLGNISVAIIHPITMGGNDLSLTANVAVTAGLTSVAMGLAWYNIRKQKIDEHRKWMLRAMFWMGTIVTMRVIMIVVTITVSLIGGYRTLWSCDQAVFVSENSTAFYEEFPACRLDPQTYIGVPAGLRSRLQIGSALRLTFSMSMWLALCLHTLCVELYIALTPKENDRLKMISYHKQRALGFFPAGSAGLTVDRLGNITSTRYPSTPICKKD